MNVSVDSQTCIGCGFCVRLCPEVFVMDFDNAVSRAKAKEIPAETRECAKEAEENCPVSPIEIRED